MSARNSMLMAVLGLAACATDTTAPPPSAEVHRYCADQMYARRVGHGRGAPSWTVYDYCVKQQLHTMYPIGWRPQT